MLAWNNNGLKNDDDDDDNDDDDGDDDAPPPLWPMDYIDSLLENELLKETNRWRDILKRILDVILFLAELGRDWL